MLRILTIARNHRLARIEGGELRRVYKPGRYVAWVPPWKLHEFIDICLHDVVQAAPLPDPLPDDLAESRVVVVAADQRLLVVEGGAVRGIWGPGRYRVWDVAGSEVVLVSVTAPPAALEEGDRWHRVSPPWTEHVANRSRALVLCEEGEPVQLLAPGRYRVWRGGPWSIAEVSTEIRHLDIAAQDLLTSDAVGVRLKPAATWVVSDPLVWSAEPRAAELVYLAVQLALRAIVSSRTLQELLDSKDALSDEVLRLARAHLPDVGVEVQSAAIKDVVLPGDMKDLLNRVVLARKEAEAKAIFRREEVAQTRQLANTAKLLENNPVLLRLKEIEALGELVSKIDKLVVVGGGDLARKVLLRELE